MATARVFWSGNSQSIRLPKEFVRPAEWPETFWRAFEGMPDDFERPPQVRQKRDSTDSSTQPKAQH